MMQSSYRKEDVTLLLKNITGDITPQSTLEREKLIQAGTHYCEMLPIEHVPSKQYMEVYDKVSKVFAKDTAQAVATLSNKLVNRYGSNIVLVSLARAGIPIGILLKRYLKFAYDIDVEHYAISIIRGRGIDKNAMDYILSKHSPEDIVFVDGWTGKGAITKQLKEALLDYPAVPNELAVLADPAYTTSLCGTHDDILIPSSCLNCTISGLLSRTVLRDDLIGENDFHGAVYYEDMKAEDISYDFIDSIVSLFNTVNLIPTVDEIKDSMSEVTNIMSKYTIKDINYIKPSIGETTRVLLRRVPWKVLIREDCRDDISVQHIIELAKDKNVPVEYTQDLSIYKTCGIIKDMADV